MAQSVSAPDCRSGSCGFEPRRPRQVLYKKGRFVRSGFFVNKNLAFGWYGTMPPWLAVIIQGAVEGVTEFIPVSSTGHLLLTERLLRVKLSDMFSIVIQSGAVLAVIPLFRNRIIQMLFNWRDTNARNYLLKLILAFAVTGVGGVILKKINFELPEEPFGIAMALLIGGIGFIIAEQWLKRRDKTSDKISWAMAIAVGVAQIVAAVFPGASRSGTTILLLLLWGVQRTAAVEFSFLVGIPTMLAAGGVEILSTLSDSYKNQSVSEEHDPWSLVILGAVIAAITSFIVVKWLLGYVRSRTFNLFGWYRIVLGIIILTAKISGVF